MGIPKKKRKMVPMYSAEDFFSGMTDAKPVGWTSDPDEPGSVIVDRASFERLAQREVSRTGLAGPDQDVQEER